MTIVLLYTAVLCDEWRRKEGSSESSEFLGSDPQLNLNETSNNYAAFGLATTNQY